MGRGHNTRSPLALDPIAPYDPIWLEALSAFERETLHSDPSGCDIPLPYGTPRFVVMECAYYPGSAPAHTFNYYIAPEELLTSLVSQVRTAYAYENYPLAYVPANGFVHIEPSGSSSGYTPPAVKRSKLRADRVRAITAEPVRLISGTYTGYERFVCITRDREGSLFFNAVTSLTEAEKLIGSQAYASTAFEAFHDLDVSGEPVPLRLSLRYTDLDGKTYEVSES